MSRRLSVPRLLAVPAVAALGALSFSQAAFATDTPVANDVATAPNCKGPDALKELVLKVDGAVVDDLRGKTHEGSAVEASFKIADGCKDVDLHLSTYEAPSAAWDPNTAEQQKLAKSVAGKFSDDGKLHTLTVKLPKCYYQVDLATGKVLNPITSSVNYGSTGALIAADNGGTTKKCKHHEPTTTTSAPTTTSTVVSEPPVPTTAAPQVLGEVVLPQQQLAATGSNASEIAVGGAVLLLLGAVLQPLAGRLRTRRSHS